MSRGAFQTSFFHEAMGRNPNRCSTNSEMNPCSFLPSSSSSSSPSSQKISQPSARVNYPWQHNVPELTESWNQVLIGGEEERARYAQYQQYLACQHSSAPGNNNTGDHEVMKHESLGSPWRSHVLPVSSPAGSCVTTSFSRNMLDFSKQKAEKRKTQLDQPSECNSTQAGELATSKKSKGQAQSPFKVRKEKLGDRITALHQLVSPFGKTDTASVLLESIGYIRFLQAQIEALSSPYLAASGGSSSSSLGNRAMQQASSGGECDYGEPVVKDLRSRGLCLVPVSFTTLHVSSDNVADFWAFGGARFLQ